MTQPVPILILGDGPDQKTGLGRIGHDLAWLLSSMPEFEVGYLGRMAFGRSKFPWQQYSFSVNEQWGESRLEEAWRDLSRGRRGVVFTVWDASRLLWLADPQGMPDSFQKLVASREFERWGYFMADGAGVRGNALPLEQVHVISRFERVLMASKWAYGLAQASVGEDLGMDLDWIPHGLNLESFQSVDRGLARSMWGVKDDDLVIGCVMANQARKHWPEVMLAVSRMPSKPFLWMHTDALKNYWDLSALAVECGMADRIFYHDQPLTDRELAMRYSGCDATVVISGGEGFCYPVAESLACGCPVVTGSYGAQFELVGQGLQPVVMVLDTLHNVYRARYKAEDIAKALEAVCHISRGQMTNGSRLRSQLRERVEHLEWKKLGIGWKKWLRQGLSNLQTTTAS